MRGRVALRLPKAEIARLRALDYRERLVERYGAWEPPWWREPPVVDRAWWDAHRQAETLFQRNCDETARIGGWVDYHTRLSIMSNAGYPDCMYLHISDGRLVVAELKVYEANGRGKPPTWDQRYWLDVWSQVPCAQVYLWYPADQPRIDTVLLSAPPTKYRELRARAVPALPD